MIEEPCPTCDGEGRLRELKKYRVNIPAGRQGGLADPAAPARARPACAAARPATCTWSPTSSESPVFQRKGDNLEVEVPITVAEAIRGADVEVPTLHGTKKLRVPGGHQARHGPAPARRGPAGARRPRRAATSTTAS